MIAFETGLFAATCGWEEGVTSVDSRLVFISLLFVNQESRRRVRLLYDDEGVIVRFIRTLALSLLSSSRLETYIKLVTVSAYSKMPYLISPRSKTPLGRVLNKADPIRLIEARELSAKISQKR